MIKASCFTEKKCVNSPQIIQDGKQDYFNQDYFNQDNSNQIIENSTNEKQIIQQNIENKIFNNLLQTPKKENDKNEVFAKNEIFAKNGVSSKTKLIFKAPLKVSRNRTTTIDKNTYSNQQTQTTVNKNPNPNQQIQTTSKEQTQTISLYNKNTSNQNFKTCYDIDDDEIMANESESSLNKEI